MHIHIKTSKFSFTNEKNNTFSDSQYNKLILDSDFPPPFVISFANDGDF